MCCGRLKGVVKLVKSVLGIGTAGGDIVARRLEICGGCDRATRLLGKLDQCGECGCLIGYKAQLASEPCPLDRWPVVDEQEADEISAPAQRPVDRASTDL